MNRTLIGLTGKKRSGKDTFADRLVSEWGFVKIGMADPIREMAYRIDPIVITQNGYARSLGDLVDQFGWDYLQSHERRVRAFLQDLGQEVRRHDPDYWTKIAESKIAVQQTLDRPVAVTGVRFLNEYSMIISRGGIIVQIEREGIADPTDPTTQNLTETAMDGFPIVHHTIHNNGTIGQLHEQADAIASIQERRRA